MGDSRWLFLFIRAIPCSYFCKHCLFAPSKRFKAMEYNTIVSAIQPFVTFQQKSRYAPYQDLAVYVGDCALNCQDFPKVVRFLKTHRIEGWQSVASDGFRKRSRQEWLSYLQDLKRAGTEILEFSLYGRGDTHDWFAGFRGSYEALHTVAGLWYEMGGRVLWSIFIHKRNLAELPHLRQELREKHRAESDIVVWGYLGWGTRIEELRIEKQDLEKLDGLSRKEIAHLKTEREWVGILGQSGEPPFSPAPDVIRLAIDGSGEVKIPYITAISGLDGISCGNVLSMPVTAVLEKWEQIYTAWVSAYPSVGYLCQNYGDVGNEHLYDEQSVIRKWCAAFESDTKRPTLAAADSGCAARESGREL